MHTTNTINPEKLGLEIRLSAYQRRCEKFEWAYIEMLKYIKDNPKFSYEDFIQIRDIFHKHFYS